MKDRITTAGEDIPQSWSPCWSRWVNQRWCNEYATSMQRSSTYVAIFKWDRALPWRNEIRENLKDYTNERDEGMARNATRPVSIKTACLCTFAVILSKLTAKVIGKDKGGSEESIPSYKEPSLRWKYSEFCISNPFARTATSRGFFSKETPLTFKWLLPTKQCRNFLSVFHVFSSTTFFFHSNFSRTPYSLSRPPFLCLTAPKHEISVSSRDLLIFDDSPCTRTLPCLWQIGTRILQLLS